VPLIDPGSLVLDVGASLGLYTIPLGLAARRVGARVVAVEPIAENCAVILHNVELNRVQDAVTLQSHALGAAPGEVTLHIESGGAGNATVVTGLDAGEVGRHDRVGNMREAETVQVRPLDDVELSPEDAGRRCSLIKLDVEGFEMDVLDGARAFIARHRPAILGEFNPTWLETRGVPATAPATWAAENGYACREVVLTRVNPASDTKKASLRPLAATGVRGGTDLLLLPDPSEPPA